MSYNFNGKVALVTGSSCGIGKAVLFALAQNGCKVILNYLHSLEETKNAIQEFKSNGFMIDAYRCNVTNEKEVRILFQRIKKKYKLLDILVNNVGEYIKKPLEKISSKEWYEIIDSNLHSTFLCTHYALPLLRKSHAGRIINIGFASSGQMVSKPQILPYQIGKTGVLLTTKAFAEVEAKNKILINMISPGVMENSVHYPKKEIPLKKKGSLKDLAKLVVQTIENDYLTGAHIEYAGGFNL